MSEPAPRPRHRGQALVWIGVAMLAALILIMIFGPSIAPYSASLTSPNSLDGPTAAHWLGTDSIGRDVLSRLIVGGRGTLIGPVIGAFIVNFAKTYLTGALPEIWLFALGALFIVVTLFLPKGVMGLWGQLRARRARPA
mgnify:CR=1 FL=1